MIRTIFTLVCLSCISMSGFSQSSQPIELKVLQASVKPTIKITSVKKDSTGKILPMFSGFTSSDSVNLTVVLKLHIDSLAPGDSLQIKAGTTLGSSNLAITKVDLSSSSYISSKGDYARVPLGNCPFNSNIYFEAQVLNASNQKSNLLSKHKKLN